MLSRFEQTVIVRMSNQIEEILSILQEGEPEQDACQSQDESDKGQAGAESGGSQVIVEECMNCFFIRVNRHIFGKERWIGVHSCKEKEHEWQPLENVDGRD